MIDLKGAIKNNLIATNNKLNTSLERVAKIIGKSSSKENSYTITVLTKTGTKEVFEDISVRYDGIFENIIRKEPKINDMVYVKEDHGRYIITGLYTEFQNKTVQSDIYSDSYNGGYGGFIQ